MSFYVYQIVDPRDLRPFYVGKGKQGRAWSHTEAVRRGKSTGNAGKDQRISEILEERLEPIVCILAEYDDQADAFKHEIELIATTAGLLNILKGGQGWGLSPDEIAKRDALLAAKKDAENIVYLSNWLAMAEKWPNGCTVPNHRNGDEMGAEYMRLVREMVAAASKVDVFRQMDHGTRD